MPESRNCRMPQLCGFVLRPIPSVSHGVTRLGPNPDGRVGSKAARDDRGRAELV